MIQFKRGSTESWKNLETPLAAGQPGYDKDKHKIKVGDGEKLWESLPYAGLSEEEVLDSEANAKIRLAQDPESMAIITYGAESPDKSTVGQLYLQHYDAEPEVDYVVEYGVDGIWTYQIWKSGLVKCWGALSFTTDIQNIVGNGYLFNNETKMEAVKYPVAFDILPTENVTLSCPENKVAWLASVTANSKTESGIYTILSFDKQISASYRIALDVKGFINRDN